LPCNFTTSSEPQLWCYCWVCWHKTWCNLRYRIIPFAVTAKRAFYFLNINIIWQCRKKISKDKIRSFFKGMKNDWRWRNRMKERTMIHIAGLVSPFEVRWLYFELHVWDVLRVLSQLDTGFSPRCPRFSPKWLYVRFMVDKATLGHVLLWVLRFSPVNLNSTIDPYSSITVP
jgi:hypothetical protein